MAGRQKIQTIDIESYFLSSTAIIEIQELLVDGERALLHCLSEKGDSV